MLYRLLALWDRHRALATWVVIAGVVGLGAYVLEHLAGR
jgi:hypothetical protein